MFRLWGTRMAVLRMGRRQWDVAYLADSGRFGYESGFSSYWRARRAGKVLKSR